MEGLIRELLTRYEWALRGYLILQFVAFAVVLVLIVAMFVTVLRDFRDW